MLRLLITFYSLFICLTCFAISHEAVFPILEKKPDNPEKVSLGSQLFQDKLFAKDKNLSCASCHQLNKGGIEKLPTYSEKPATLNTPTVFNSSLNLRQFWNARAKTLNEVIDDHLLDDTVFANSWGKVTQRLNESSTYPALFSASFQDGINANNVKEALTLYLQTLVTPSSPFDRYLQGDQKALSNEAKKGFQLFQQYGCISCHQGPNLGGNLMQRLGIYKNYFQGKNIKRADLGYFNVTHQEQDKFVFKVPSLRNVAITSPYLHDGSIKDLDEVIKIMGIYQVGQPILAYDIPYLIKFLESLTGNPPKNDP